MQIITISGNATRDAELKFTQSGKSVSGFGVAVNDRIKNEAGEWVDGEPTFIDVTAWGKLAEGVAATVTKGTRVVVSGRLRTEVWVGQDGETRRSLKLTADEVGLSVLFMSAAGVTPYDRERQPQVQRQSAAPAGDGFDPYNEEEPF